MISWDISILHQINREWTHPLLDWLMPALSAINAWVPLLILVVLLLFWLGGNRGRMTVLCFLVALGVGDGIVSYTIKKAVDRVRPRDAIENVMVRDLGKGSPEFMRLFTAPTQRLSSPRGEVHGSSFPSSHTVTMFASATVVALFYRRAGMGVYFLAILVAYSRLYVGAHWPSDIVPSIGIGILIGWAVTRLIQRICIRRFGAF